MIPIVDLEALRAEAFNFLGRFPEYSSNVLALIEEIENERDQVFTLRKMRDEDAKIIKGMVEYFKLADNLCTVLEAYTENVVNEEVLYQALNEWKDSAKKIKI